MRSRESSLQGRADAPGRALCRYRALAPCPGSCRAALLRHGWDALAFPYPLNYGEGPLLDQSVRLAQFQTIYRTDLTVSPYDANYPPLFMLAQVPLCGCSVLRSGTGV